MFVKGGHGFTKFSEGGVQHAMKIWSQSDRTFCKNEGSKRFKNKENDQQEQNQGENLVQTSRVK